MALISQEALLGMLVPDIYIDGITLESSGVPAIVDNPHIDDVREIESRQAFNDAMDNRTMRVTVDLSLKERLDNDLIGSWFREQEFHKYLKIKVIQTTHPGLISLFSYNQNMINFATEGLREGNMSEDEVIRLLEVFGSNEEAWATLFNPDMLQVSTLSVSADVIGDNSDLTQISSSIDENGVSIHDFTYRAVYNLSVLNPSELGIFAVSYLDLGAMKSDYDLEFNIGTLDSQNGKVVSEIVLKRGKVVSTASVFTTSAGEVWGGPIHQTGPRSYATDSEPSPTSVKLTRRTVPNDMVQDFRDVDEIMKYSLDISTVSKAIDVLNDQKLLTNDRDFIDHKRTHYSDLWLSRDADGGSRFMFAFDMRSFLKHNSIYGNLLNRESPAIRNQILENAKVREVTLLRRRVKDVKTLNKLGSIATGQILFDKAEPYESLILTATGPTGVLAERNNSKAVLREADLVVSNADSATGIYYYTGQDKTMSSVTDGLYQYGVRLDVEDGTTGFLRSITDELVRAREDIKLYLEYASRLGMTKFLQEISNPHIDHENERQVSVLESSGHYDPLKNRFTQKFLTFVEEQYVNPASPLYQRRPWIDATIVYTKALTIISQDAELAMTVQKVNIADKISVFMSPTSGTPRGIMAVLNLYNHLISKYQSLTGDDYRERGRATMAPPSATTQSSVTSGQNRPGVILESENWFHSNFFDSNIKKTSGLDYLTDMRKSLRKETKHAQSMAMQEYKDLIFGGAQQRGLKIVDGGYWTERINTETNKYFTDLSPNLNISFGKDIYTDSDSVSNTSFGFLSPGYIVANNKAHSMSLDQDADYYVLVEAELLAQNAEQGPTQKDGTSGTNQSESEKVYQSSMENLFSGHNVTVAPTVARMPIPEMFAGLYGDSKLDLCANQQLQAVDPYPSWNLDADGNVVSIAETETEEPLGSSNSNYVDFFKKVSSIIINNDTKPGDMTADTEKASVSKFDLSSGHNVLGKLKEDGQLASSIAASNGRAGIEPTVANVVSSLPNHMKSLVLSRTNPAAVRFDWAGKGIDPFNDWLHSSKFNLNYQFIVSVERFDGFDFAELSDGETRELSVRRERWVPLTEQFYVASSGQEILCRLTPYACHSLGIVKLPGIDAPVYDAYFMIVPPKRAARSSQFDFAGRLRSSLESRWNRSSVGISQFATTNLITK